MFCLFVWFGLGALSPFFVLSEIRPYKDMSQTQTISKNKLIAQHKKEAIRVFENDKFIIVLPKTYNAMFVYGYGATWCVTSSDEYIFESYSDNPLFVIMIKGSKIGQYQEKYLCQFETHGIVDIMTEEVKYKDFFGKFGELIPVFRELIENDKFKKYSEYEKDYFINCLIK